MESEIPDDMKYYLKNMQFARTNVRVSPLSSSSGVGLGDSIVFRLPSNSLVDLSTFGVMFDMTASIGLSGEVHFGRGSHNLIRSMQLSIGGNTVINQNNFGRVYSAMHLLTSSNDSNSSKQYLTYDVDLEAVNIGTASMGTVHMAWLDFPCLNWSTNIVDSSLYGQIELTIQLHSNAAEAGFVASNGNSISLQLNNISGKLDVINTDPMYRQVLQESLNSGASLQVSIPNYFTFESSHSDQAMASTFTISSACLDGLLICPHKSTKSTDSTTSGDQLADADKSPYRTHPAARFCGLRIDTVNVDVNGQQILSNMQRKEFMYHQLTNLGIKGGLAANALSQSGRKSTVAGGFEADSLADYIAQGFVVPVRFDHGNDINGRVLSGINGSASNGIQISVNTTLDSTGNGGTSFDSKLLTVAQCKSVLTVSAGGVVSFQA